MRTKPRSRRRAYEVFGYAVCATLAMSCAAADPDGADTREVDATSDNELTQSNLPVADTFVHSGYPATNFGSRPQLYADLNSPVRKYAFFKFAVPSGSIAKAKIHLYLADGTSSGVDVYGVSNSWAESTLTWNNKPALGTHVASVGAAAGGAWLDVDVTSHVKAGTNVSFAIVPKTEDGIVINSKEAGSDRPKLVVDLSTTSLGIPFGPYTLFDPSTQTPRPNTGVFTMAKDASTADNVLKFLSAIKTHGKKWLFTPTGGGHDLYMSDANGGTCDKWEADQNLCKFDLNRWKTYMAAYNTPTIKTAINQAIADGIIIAAALIDEPYVHGVGGPGSNTWGEDPSTGKSPITKAIVDSMCAYAKSIFPNLPVGPVHQPAYFEPDKSYEVCDLMIVEYSWATKLLDDTSNKGNVIEFRDEALWMAQRDGIRMLFGLNILDGGIPSTVAGSCAYGDGTYGSHCRMSPDQVRDWGKVLGAAGCGLDMWRYDDTFMASANNQLAFKDIAAYLAGKPRQSCRKP